MKFSFTFEGMKKINHLLRGVFYAFLVFSIPFCMIDKGNILILSFKDALSWRQDETHKASMGPLSVMHQMGRKVQAQEEESLQYSTSESYRHRKRSSSLSPAPSIAFRQSWRDGHDQVINSIYKKTGDFYSWWKTTVASETIAPSPQPFVPPTPTISTETPELSTWNAVSLKVRCMGDVWVGIGGPIAHQDSTAPIMRINDKQKYSNPVITKDLHGTNMTFVLPILSETVSQGVMPLLWEYGLHNNTLGFQRGNLNLQLHQCLPASIGYMTLSACNSDDKNYDQMNTLVEGVTGPIAVLYTKLIHLP